MSTLIEQVLVVHQVRAASIYKLLSFGLVISLIPIGVVFGITGFFGADTVKWNNQPIHGVAALFAGPALCASIALLISGFLGTLTCLGLWLLSRFRTLSIRVVMAPQEADIGSSASGGSTV